MRKKHAKNVHNCGKFVKIYIHMDKEIKHNNSGDRVLKKIF